LLRYPAKIQKSGVNPDPGSGLWSGSSSKVKSVRPCPDICRHATFHQNPCVLE